MLSMAQQEVEVTIELDKRTNELIFDDLKQMRDSSRILKDATDFTVFQATHEATMSFMQQRCLDLFPAALWNELDGAFE
jgi:hypothetical protein